MVSYIHEDFKSFYLYSLCKHLFIVPVGKITHWVRDNFYSISNSLSKS